MCRFNLVLLFAFFSILSVFAQQVPQKMNYQAVARTADGQVISNKQVALRIAIMSGDDMNRPVFAEEHSVETNKLGLMNIHIGGGELLEGSMQSIEWGTSAHYLKILMDSDGTGQYVEMGTSQLLTVPYAFYAERSGTDGEAGSRDDPNDWTINGNTGTNDVSNFLGTTDMQDLVFKTNGEEGMRLNTDGELDVRLGNRILIGSRPVISARGVGNTFIGDLAGNSISTGYNNAFIGYKSGLNNTSGHSNAFIGFKAGENNSSGFSNAFIGQQAGKANTIGKTNVMIGRRAGFANTEGDDNVFIGHLSGLGNVNGSSNTYLGSGADGAGALVNATALGAGATVTQDSSIVLGNSAKVGIGTSSPQYELDIKGDASVSGRYIDSNGNAGTSGQVLSSTGNGTDWITGSGSGSAGPTGPTGPEGIPGANGSEGATGPSGSNGSNGLAGANGIDGATGSQGPQGPTGLAGANGSDGATGPQGPTGLAGTNGVQGPTGADGNNGATGTTGPQGPAGLAGTNGVQGP
ncbi:MAG: hypothetical protein ACI9YU_001851, partial [Flavobacteriales bacterium]